MKKIFAIAALAIVSFSFQPAHAQINVNININKQPMWGPVGNDHVDYYYLPEEDCYYDVAKTKFIYKSGNKWVSAKSLPAKYKNVDLYKTYKVVVNEPNPFQHNYEHKQQYAQYKNVHNQVAIRDSREEKYFENKKHPEHKNWEKQQKEKKGRH